MRKVGSVIGIMIMAVMVAGCYTPLDKVGLTPCDDEPRWVTQGSGEYGNNLRGVGVVFAADTDNKEAGALKEAKKHLRPQLQAWTSQTNRNMARAMGSAFKRGQGGADLFFENATEGFVEAALEASKLQARWNCDITGEEFCSVGISEQKLISMYYDAVQSFADSEGDSYLNVPKKAFKKAAKRRLTR